MKLTIFKLILILSIFSILLFAVWQRGYNYFVPLTQVEVERFVGEYAKNKLHITKHYDEISFDKEERLYNFIYKINQNNRVITYDVSIDDIFWKIETSIDYEPISWDFKNEIK